MGGEGIGITGGPGASNGMWAPGPHHHHAVGCIDSFFFPFFLRKINLSKSSITKGPMLDIVLETFMPT